MNSIDLLNRFTEMLSDITADGLILPLRVNGVPVDNLRFSLHLVQDGDKYINLTVTNDKG